MLSIIGCTKNEKGLYYGNVVQHPDTEELVEKAILACNQTDCTLQKVRWVYPPRWWDNPTICSTHYGGFELIARTHQNSWDNPTICSTHYGGFELIARTHQNSWVVQHSACMCACVEGWGLTARARVLWLEVRRYWKCKEQKQHLCRSWRSTRTQEDYIPRLVDWWYSVAKEQAFVWQFKM